MKHSDAATPLWVEIEVGVLIGSVCFLLLLEAARPFRGDDGFLTMAGGASFSSTFPFRLLRLLLFVQVSDCSFFEEVVVLPFAVQGVEVLLATVSVGVVAVVVSELWGCSSTFPEDDMMHCSSELPVQRKGMEKTDSQLD